jgi:hypothetical protein
LKKANSNWQIAIGQGECQISISKIFFASHENVQGLNVEEEQIAIGKWQLAKEGVSDLLSAESSCKPREYSRAEC